MEKQYKIQVVIDAVNLPDCEKIEQIIQKTLKLFELSDSDVTISVKSTKLEKDRVEFEVSTNYCVSVLEIFMRFFETMKVYKKITECKDV